MNGSVIRIKGTVNNYLYKFNKYRSISFLVSSGSIEILVRLIISKNKRFKIKKSMLYSKFIKIGAYNKILFPPNPKFCSYFTVQEYVWWLDNLPRSIIGGCEERIKKVLKKEKEYYEDLLYSN